MTLLDLLRDASDGETQRLIRAAYYLGAADALKPPDDDDLMMLRNQAE